MWLAHRTGCTIIRSEWWEAGSMALHESRGYYSAWHKVFMRGTVLACDLLVLFPTTVYFSRSLYSDPNKQVCQRDNDAACEVAHSLPCARAAVRDCVVGNAAASHDRDRSRALSVQQRVAWIGATVVRVDIAEAICACEVRSPLRRRVRCVDG